MAQREPMKVEVKNTFLEYPGITALRTPSLDEFLRMAERKVQSSPVSAIQGLAERPVESGPCVDSTEDTFLPAPPGLEPYPVKHGFIDYPALRNPSLEQFLKERQVKSCPASWLTQYPDQDHASERSTAASLSSEKSDGTPGQHTEAEFPGADPMSTDPMVISLTESLGMWSVGSARHGNGFCKPCAFIWKDGCQDGPNCSFCHLCPPGEMRRRKKEKIQWRKVSRQVRHNAMRSYMALF